MNTDSKNTETEQCTIPNVMRSFSLEEVKKIASDIMNLGMELRQNQLNGSDGRSGNEVMKDYFDESGTRNTGTCCFLP
tara:strand:- start:451 stop:684 length:234 start_codon:yes stop_codon:yes gene_type:complete